MIKFCIPKPWVLIEYIDFTNIYLIDSVLTCLQTSEGAQISYHKVRLYRKQLFFRHFTVKCLLICRKNYMTRMSFHYCTMSHKNKWVKTIGVVKQHSFQFIFVQ